MAMSIISPNLRKTTETRAKTPPPLGKVCPRCGMRVPNVEAHTCLRLRVKQ